MLYHAYRRVNDWVERLIVLVACVLTAVVVVMPFVSMAVRLLTGEGYTFLAESPPQLVPWIVFLMIGVLLRHDGHIAVDTIPHFLRGRALRAVRLLVLALCVAGTLAMGYFGIRTTAFFANLGQLSTTEIEFPLWYLYVSYPIGLLLAANFCLEALIGEATGHRVVNRGGLL